MRLQRRQQQQRRQCLLRGLPWFLLLLPVALAWASSSPPPDLPPRLTDFATATTLTTRRRLRHYNDDNACGKCRQPLHGGGEFIQTQNEQRYHTTCFVCSDCGGAIHGAFQQELDPTAINGAAAPATDLYHPTCFKKRFALTCHYCGDYLGHEWTEFDHEKYHPTCYATFVQPRCDVCGQGLDNGSWCVTDPWGHTAHTEHGQDTCSCCQRIVSDATSQGGTALPDGRLVCGICQSTAVTTSHQLPTALNRVLTDLQRHLRIGRDGHGGDGGGGVGGFANGQIHIHLATRDALTRKAHEVGCAHGNFHGLTTTTRITTALATLPSTFTTMEHEITLLTGLPEVQFRGVLAHELLHVWLNEAGLQPPTELMEGFCNLGSHVVYTTETQNADLAAVLLQQMEQDPDPVYGDGYRLMKDILQRQGWSGVLRKISSYRRS